MSGPWEKYGGAVESPAGPWEKYSAPMSRMEKVGKGLVDPIEGGAQLLTHVLPDSVVNAGNWLNNWLADKTGMVSKLPEGGIDQMVADRENAYQAKRTAAGESGFDGYRVLGNVASPANIALASKLPQATSLAGRIGTGVFGGGASALTNPVADGDFWSEKGQQVATGAAFGGAVPGLTGAVARMISPNASKNASLQLLKAEGVKPTIGQSLGGWANAVEEKAQSLPIFGDAITAARRGASEQLNRAAFSRALKPIGEKLPMTVKGQEAVQYVGEKLGAAYDNLLPKLTTQADAPFAQHIQGLQQMVAAGALDPKYSALFERTLKTRVMDKFQGQNVMTGQTLKDTESFLSNEIKRFGMSQDPDARLIGDAFKEVQSGLRELVARTNPQHAKELKAINAGYANFKRVQRAAAGLGADEGVFSAAQLHNSVKASDRSKDKGRFARGDALMQDLSGAAKATMGGKVPDSGTAGRLFLGGMGAGSYFVNPAIPAGLLAGAAAYSPPAQSMLRGLVSSRPQGAESVAETFRKTSPFLIPGGAQVGLGLLDY